LKFSEWPTVLGQMPQHDDTIYCWSNLCKSLHAPRQIFPSYYCYYY
jgi:hypothetical protein